MKQRYRQYMNAIHPSDALPSRIEAEMCRELRHKRRKGSTPARLGAVAAALVLVTAGIMILHPRMDTVSPPTVSAPVATDQAPTPSAAPTATLCATDVPDDTRLELEMSDELAFAAPSIIDDAEGAKLFDNCFVGARDSSSVELHQSSTLNSPVVALLRPGTAYWPHDEDGDIVDLTDGDGTVVGCATRVTYLHEETNALKEGWLHIIDDADPLPGTSDDAVEIVHLPGKVKSVGTVLRHGANADAPVVAALAEGQRLCLGFRVGNWLYASTEPFCADDETAVTGWIYIADVVGLNWRTAIDHVDLTTDGVNLRTAPDGELIYTLSLSDAEADMITYSGITIPGKSGDWHYVSVGAGFFEDIVQTGYINADLSRLHTFRLGSELALDGVISATLNYSGGSALGASEQSVSGERLDLLLERLHGAYSQWTDVEVCAEGIAQITLTYADGHTVSLPLSGDSCTQVRWENVVYDLRTDAERTEHFLNDGGVSLSDILSPIFDQIRFP